MKQYQLAGQHMTGHVAALYDADGQLQQVDFSRATLTREQKRFVLNKLPLTSAELPAFSGAYNIAMVEVAVELTFDMFWTAYGKKINKVRCQPLWAKLSTPQQARALQGIKVYDAFLKKEAWRKKMDPENYLRTQAWENEWQ